MTNHDEATLSNIYHHTDLILRQMKHYRRQLDQTNQLVRVLINGGAIHEIGSYTYGRTSNDDPFLLLYSSNTKLIHKICRVYKEDFAKLPHYLDLDNFPTNVTDSNPTRDNVVKQHKLKTCATFTIATKPGAETQMGPEQRFHMVIDQTPVPKKKETPPPPPPPEKEPFATELDTTDPETALQNLNNLLGNQDLHATPPEPPYKYLNSDPVNDHPKPQAIFLLFWDIFKKLPASADALSLWYSQNTQMIEEKLQPRKETA